MRLGHWGGGIDFEFRVPPHARFEAGVGYRGMVSLDDLHEHPRKTHMRVEVGVDGVFETVAEQKVSDARMEGRRWTDFAVDLSRFEGQEITLRLSAVPAVPVGKRNLSWWASPRIVVADATAQAQAARLRRSPRRRRRRAEDEPRAGGVRADLRARLWRRRQDLLESLRGGAGADAGRPRGDLRRRACRAAGAALPGRRPALKRRAKRVDAEA